MMMSMVIVEATTIVSAAVYDERSSFFRNQQLVYVVDSSTTHKWVHTKPKQIRHRDRDKAVQQIVVRIVFFFFFACHFNNHKIIHFRIPTTFALPSRLILLRSLKKPN